MDSAGNADKPLVRALCNLGIRKLYARASFPALWILIGMGRNRAALLPEALRSQRINTSNANKA
jgi:hypothetical protein